MNPTKKQKYRRYRSFPFVYDGRRGWFYLCQDGASFHQPGENGASQQNVIGLRISRLVKALKDCGYIALMLCLPVVVEAKEVAMPYEDFLQVLTKIEHSEKLRNKAVAENGVLVKLKGEQETIIKLQADQIQACEKIVQQQEQLGATQDQINTAVGIELGRVQTELDREKRLSRYKSEAFWMGVIGVGLWILN